jgi:hypothetical protein
MKVWVKRWLVAGGVSVGFGFAAAMFGWPTSSASADTAAAAHHPAVPPMCCPVAGGWEQLLMHPGR